MYERQEFAKVHRSLRHRALLEQNRSRPSIDAPVLDVPRVATAGRVDAHAVEHHAQLLQFRGCLAECPRVLAAIFGERFGKGFLRVVAAGKRLVLSP
jgi:hypothetical protein